MDIYEENELNVKKKRGRKPNPDKKNKYYFSKAEEDAVLKYIQSDSAIEKNKIYNEILCPVFTTMIESIMRRYDKYVPCEDSGDTFNDTMSFLLTKLDKFDITRNKKAYSFYGNVCKNYITGKIQTYNKSIVRNPSYDDQNTDVDLFNNIKYTNSLDSGSKIAIEIVEELTKYITIMIKDPKKYDLKASEVKLGEALVNLLKNWDFVISTDGSNKLNKQAILFFIREQTGFDTKGVRDNLKKFKKAFLIIKDKIINGIR